MGTNHNLIFVGQCNLNDFYSLKIETLVFANGEVRGVMAYSSTITYFWYQDYINDNNAYRQQMPVLFRVHFDPDTTSCGTRTYLTPPDARYWIPAKPYYFCQPTDNCSVMNVILRWDIGAIMVFGSSFKFEFMNYGQDKGFAQNHAVGFVHAIKLSVIDKMMNENNDIKLVAEDKRARRLTVLIGDTAITNLIILGINDLFTALSTSIPNPNIVMTPFPSAATELNKLVKAEVDVCNDSLFLNPLTNYVQGSTLTFYWDNRNVIEYETTPIGDIVSNPPISCGIKYCQLLNLPQPSFISTFNWPKLTINNNG